MTQQELRGMITDLVEVRREISRINIAAGLTIFNPAATEALQRVIDCLVEEVKP